MTTEIEKLEQQRAKINYKIQKIKNKDAKQKRAEDTRRKIMIGSYILAQVEKGMMDKNDLIKSLDSYLTKDRDRILFGLSKIEDKP